MSKEPERPEAGENAAPEAAPASGRAADSSSSSNADGPTEPRPTLSARFLGGMGRAFRHRNYRLFFMGQLVSLVGTWMQAVAQSWLVYQMTGSSMLLGLVGFCSQIPVFLLAPFGGAAADKRSRREILLMTQAASMLLAFVLAGLTLTGRVQVWHVFTLAAMLGVVNAVDVPTRQAFVTEMVGREDLVNAIALNSAMFNSARALGPAVAGLLVAAVGEGWCFFLNGASYAAVIVGYLAMNVPPRVALPSRTSTLNSIREGFVFAWNVTPVRALLLLLGLGSLAAMPYATLMPIFADSILAGGPKGLGVLMSSAGAGALIGALVLAARKQTKGLGAWVWLAALGFGVSLILFSMSRDFRLSCFLLMPAGFCMIVTMAASNTIIQILTPDELRGRVMALYAMMLMGMAPFGALLAGVLAHVVGAPATVAMGGAASIVGALVFGWRLPALRVEARRIIVSMQAAGGEPPEQSTGKGV